MTQTKEPELVLPPGILTSPIYPTDRHIYIPLPNNPDQGIYVGRSGLVALLRANKANPEAIQYLADMLE